MAKRRCPECEWKAHASENDHRCMLHGHRFAMFKCDSCCSVATWSCHSHHYCERCHNQAGQPKHYPCPGPGKCPLGICHPPNLPAVHMQTSSHAFVLGCSICFGLPEGPETEDFEDLYTHNQFGYPQRDWFAFKDASSMLAAMEEGELQARCKFRGIDLQGPNRSEAHCALLLLDIEKEPWRHANFVEASRRALLASEEAYWRDLQLEEACQRYLLPLDAADLKMVRNIEREISSLRAYARTSKSACKVPKSTGKGWHRFEKKCGKTWRLSKRGGRHKVGMVQWSDMDF